MKGKLALCAVTACIAVLAQGKRVDWNKMDVPTEKTYDAPVDKVFGAMVQAAAGFEIKTALKDGCVVQFAHVSTNLEISAFCTELADGKTKVVIRLFLKSSDGGMVEDLKPMSSRLFDLKFHEKSMAGVFWQSMDKNIQPRTN